MTRLYYILIMITVGMLASCSLSFDSFIDEEDADLANNGDGFTAPRHIKNETGTATYQFHENVVWLNHDDYYAGGVAPQSGRRGISCRR